ncbi:MAG: hypothetical protein Hals2KO_06920 [Halioglobus sp.]
MKGILVVILLAALPQMASARVYMCTDHATGKTLFTDRACEPEASNTREEVRVDATNLGSGSRYKKNKREKSWNSERETRKSGLDYNEKRRDVHQQGSASIN